MKLKTITKTMAAVIAVALCPMAQAKTDNVPGVSSQPDSYFYTGKPYDADLGAYTFAYRNYDPQINRWTTADHCGFPDGANNRGYMPTPTSELDYLGAFAITGATDAPSSVTNSAKHLQAVGIPVTFNALSAASTFGSTLNTYSSSTQQFVFSGTELTSASVNIEFNTLSNRTNGSAQVANDSIKMTCSTGSLFWFQSAIKTTPGTNNSEFTPDNGSGSLYPWTAAGQTMTDPVGNAQWIEGCTFTANTFLATCAITEVPGSTQGSVIRVSTYTIYDGAVKWGLSVHPE